MKNAVLTTVCTIISLISLAIPTLSLANKMQQSMSTYWQCTATDADKLTWVGKQSTRQAAINQAAFACRDNTASKNSCVAARESCQQIVNNRIVRPAWRCTAFDSNSYYRSEPQYTREDTINSALQKCRSMSFSPNSCTVSLMTCKSV